MRSFMIKATPYTFIPVAAFSDPTNVIDNDIPMSDAYSSGADVELESHKEGEVTKLQEGIRPALTSPTPAEPAELQASIIEPEHVVEDQPNRDADDSAAESQETIGRDQAHRELADTALANPPKRNRPLTPAPPTPPTHNVSNADQGNDATLEQNGGYNYFSLVRVLSLIYTS